MCTVGSFIWCGGMRNFRTKAQSGAAITEYLVLISALALMLLAACPLFIQTVDARLSRAAQQLELAGIEESSAGGGTRGTGGGGDGGGDSS